jgi:hypothetical protein
MIGNSSCCHSECGSSCVGATTVSILLPGLRVEIAIEARSHLPAATQQRSNYQQTVRGADTCCVALFGCMIVLLCDASPPVGVFGIYRYRAALGEAQHRPRGTRVLCVIPAQQPPLRQDRCHELS